MKLKILKFLNVLKMLGGKKFILLLLSLLCFSSIFSYSSAWLVNEKKFKIISQLEFKKFHEVSKNYDKNYTMAEINYFKVNLEYGISAQRNLLGEVNFNNLHSYRYTVTHNQEKFIRSKKSARFFMFPDEFDSASIGIRNKIFKRESSAASHDINLRIFQKARNEKFELGYKIAYGKDFDIFKRNFFIQAEYLFNYNPFFCNYDNKVAFSLGYKKSPKKMYLLYLENYNKRNYYDKFLGKRANLIKKLNETRVELFSITHINKKTSFQKSVFATINREKSFASSGINIGLWFNL